MSEDAKAHARPRVRKSFRRRQPCWVGGGHQIRFNLLWEIAVYLASMQESDKDHRIAFNHQSDAILTGADAVVITLHSEFFKIGYLTGIIGLLNVLNDLRDFFQKFTIIGPFLQILGKAFLKFDLHA
jgi:hypothetical protein